MNEYVIALAIGTVAIVLCGVVAYLDRKGPRP